MKRPNLFIIGAPKCGTTAMAQYLSKHPKVFFSRIKEPHFFNETSGHRFYFSVEKYLDLFRDAGSEHEYVAEGSVWYLFSVDAVSNILDFNPTAKFIVMLRNPVEMFFSLHQELLFGGAEDQVSATKAWHLQEDRSNGKNIPKGCLDTAHLQYREVCSLGNQVDKLLQKVNFENVHFVTLDELKKDSEKCFWDTLRFLNLELVSLPKFEIVNKKKVRKYPVLFKLIKYIVSMKRFFGIEVGFGIGSWLNRLNVTSGVSLNEKNPDGSELEQSLYSIFESDISLLERLTGLDLSVWKRS